MRCGKGNDEELALRFERRNPRECAVAKFEHITESIGKSRRNPRECAVAKTGTHVQVDVDSLAKRTTGM